MKTNHFWLRCRLAYWAFTKPHLLTLSVPPESLRKQIRDQECYDMQLLRIGLQPYNVWRCVKDMANGRDDIDMVLEKARYEAEAEIYTRKG